MKTDMFFMKVLTTESPYFQIVRGNFRYEDAVMAKADELKRDASVQKIVIKKRKASKPFILDGKPADESLKIETKPSDRISGHGPGQLLQKTQQLHRERK